MSIISLLNPALRYFIEVVECGSIRLAADRLQIAPSAISRQMAQLESELDAALLVRSRSGIELTQQGHVLLEYAQSSRLDIDRLQGALDDLSGLRRGSVVLATVEAMIGRVLPQCIAAFRNKFPGVELEVRILGTHQVAEAVVRQDVDIGIALDPPLRNEILLRMRWPQPLQAIMRPDHPLNATKTKLTLPQVLGFPHVLPDRSFGIRSLIERSAAKSGAKTNPFLQTNSLDVAKSVVFNSEVVTVLPPEVVVREVTSGALVALPIEDRLLASATIDVITLRTKPLTKAAESLLTFVRRSIADHKVR